MKLIVFDTETTGLPKTKAPATKGPNNWPHLVSLAWIVVEDDRIVKEVYRVIHPSNWVIPPESTAIHGITHEQACREGVSLRDALLEFTTESADCWIAHNMQFDANVIAHACLWDTGMPFAGFPKRFCTMESSRQMCALPFPAGGTGYKPPRLHELYRHVMKRDPEPNRLHNSLYDAQCVVTILQHCAHLRGMIGLPIGPSLSTTEDDRPSHASRTLSISFT